MFAIESANIVGYQQVKIPQGFSLFTVTFKNVGDTNFDLKSIIPCDSEGNKLTTCVNKIKLQKMDETGTYLPTTYGYITTGGRGWCKGTTALSDGEVTFKSGEAVCVNNTLSSDAYLQVSGEVDLTPQTMVIPNGFTLIGNMTPATVDIKTLIPVNATTGEVVTSCVNKIKLQKMDETGTYLPTTYGYITTGGRGWCKGTTALADGEVELAPGESVCVNNTLGYPVILKFPAPVK